MFLSLILLLILSLIFTIIEGARISTAKVFANRALSTAMDSALAEYYGPLWDEYHIFGYYPGDGSKEENQAQMAARITEYMSYCFYPAQELEEQFPGQDSQLIDITTEQVNICNETGLMDYDGELIINEAVEYMKYQKLGDGLEELLNKLNLLETPAEVRYVMEEKLKVEDELAEVDRGILELMELLDGIKTSSNGVVTASDGSLQTITPFIKMICYDEITKDSVGINNEKVFEVVKDCYINPKTKLASISADMNRVELILREISSLQEDMKAAEMKLQQELAELSSLYSSKNASENSNPEEKKIKENKTEDNTVRESNRKRNNIKGNNEKENNTGISAIPGSIIENKSIDKMISEESNTKNSDKKTSPSAVTKENDINVKKATLEGQIETTKDSIEKIENSIREQKKILQEVVSSIRTSNNSLLSVVTELLPKIDKALSCVDTILLQTKVAAPMIKEYEEFLSSEKEYIDASVYKGLEEGLAELKKYVSTDDKGYDFEGMKTILKRNKEVLNTTQISLVQAEENLKAEQYTQAKDILQTVETLLSSYQIKGLTLDYSSLVLDRSGRKTPIENLNDLLTQGLTGLVVDENSISDAELTTDDALPSEIAEFKGESRDCLAELTRFLEDGLRGYGKSGINEMFEAFYSETDISGYLQDGLNEAAELLLYQEYLKEHFDMYQEDSGKAQKPSALEYEQEYLLVGKPSDQDNIASVVSRIILMRTVADFATILGNKTILSEAKLIATSLVGFTGMPMLIGLTQVLILIMWAFAEALLDTCALMMGKEVPILKTSITLQFADLFLISRGYLQERAAKMPDSKQISFSYQDYLRVFLLMADREELTYRSLDLMQENIRLRYQQENFQISQCLYGFEAEADYGITAKFTAFSFVQKYISQDTEGFRYTARSVYSY